MHKNNIGRVSWILNITFVQNNFQSHIYIQPGNFEQWDWVTIERTTVHRHLAHMKEKNCDLGDTTIQFIFFKRFWRTQTVAKQKWLRFMVGSVAGFKSKTYFAIPPHRKKRFCSFGEKTTFFT